MVASDGERLVKVVVKETTYLQLKPCASVKFSKGAVITLRESVVRELEEKGQVRRVAECRVGNPRKTE